MEVVSGDFTIRATNIASLSGLDGLKSASSVIVEANTQLEDISALAHLTNTRRIVFRGNPGLKTPATMTGLSTLDELVIVESGFVSLTGLGSLRTVHRLE